MRQKTHEKQKDTSWRSSFGFPFPPRRTAATDGRALRRDPGLLPPFFARAFDPYRPELHYMRGPGPACRAKQPRPASHVTFPRYFDAQALPFQLALACHAIARDHAVFPTAHTAPSSSP